MTYLKLITLIEAIYRIAIQRAKVATEAADKAALAEYLTDIDYADSLEQAAQRMLERSNAIVDDANAEYSKALATNTALHNTLSNKLDGIYAE